MNWDDLRVVSAIHRTGSFTRAAAALDLDETTTARRIARIEATLGVTLFMASHGRREPTEDCRRILRRTEDTEGHAAARGPDRCRLIEGWVVLTECPAVPFRTAHGGGESRTVKGSDQPQGGHR